MPYAQMTAEKRKALRHQARREGKCGECGSRPAREGKSSCVECAEQGRARDKAAREKANPPPALDGRLAKPAKGELCGCGKQVAFAGVEFCARCGRDYVRDLKGRFKP